MSCFADEVGFYAELERRVRHIRAQMPYYAAFRRYRNTYIAGYEQALAMVLSQMLCEMPPAQRIEARSDETPEAVQPEGREPGSEGMRP